MRFPRMQTRGAPLIGAVAAYGLALAMRDDASDENLERAYASLLATRPTAINLKWALDEMMAAVRNQPREQRVAAAYQRAKEICDEDVAINEAIGRNGLAIIEDDCRTQEAGRAHQCADALQCRLAGDSGLGHGARRRSTWRMTRAFRSMCGWTRRVRAIRARR